MNKKSKKQIYILAYKLNYDYNYHYIPWFFKKKTQKVHMYLIVFDRPVYASSREEAWQKYASRYSKLLDHIGLTDIIESQYLDWEDFLYMDDKIKRGTITDCKHNTVIVERDNSNYTIGYLQKYLNAEDFKEWLFDTMYLSNIDIAKLQNTLGLCMENNKSNQITQDKTQSTVTDIYQPIYDNSDIVPF